MTEPMVEIMQYFVTFSQLGENVRGRVLNEGGWPEDPKAMVYMRMIGGPMEGKLCICARDQIGPTGYVSVPEVEARVCAWCGKIQPKNVKCILVDKNICVSKLFVFCNS